MKNKRLKVDDYLVKGIYFLYQNKKIVYVGKSNINVMERICAHYLDSTKQFDSFKIINFNKLSPSQLLSKEEYFIRKYKPCHNIIHNKHKINKQLDKQIACVHEWQKIRPNTKSIKCKKCNKTEPIIFVE